MALPLGATGPRASPGRVAGPLSPAAAGESAIDGAGGRPEASPGFASSRSAMSPCSSRAVPAVTELVWTGASTTTSRASARRPRSALRRLPALRRALDRAEFDLVVGHPPAAVPWQPGARRRPAPPLQTAARPAMIVRSLGIRLLLRPTRTPVAILDLGGSRPSSGAHNFALLDRARVYFKRELPADRSTVFADAAPVTCRAGSSRLAAPRRLVRQALAHLARREPDPGRRDRVGHDAPPEKSGRRVLRRPGRGSRPASAPPDCPSSARSRGRGPDRPGDRATRPPGVLPPVRARVDHLVSGRTRMGLLSPLRGRALRERAAHESAVDPAPRASSGGEHALYYERRDGRSRADRPGRSRGSGETEPDGDRGTRPRPALSHAGTPVRARRSLLP